MLTFQAFKNSCPLRNPQPVENDRTTQKSADLALRRLSKGISYKNAMVFTASI